MAATTTAVQCQLYGHCPLEKHFRHATGMEKDESPNRPFVVELRGDTVILAHEGKITTSGPCTLKDKGLCLGGCTTGQSSNGVNYSRCRLAPPPPE